METKKDFMKVVITALVTIILTLTITGVFNYPKSLKQEFIIVEKKANEYTDKAILQHTAVQVEEMKKIQSDITDIKIMTGKLLDIELKK